MLSTRRHMFMTVVGALFTLAAKPLFSNLEQSGAPPKARPYPNGRDPNVVPGNEEPSQVDPKAVEKANQKKLREDVARLYEMASELKEQLEKTDSSFVVSVSFVKKAEQIEKLAKQIKSLAKG